MRLRRFTGRFDLNVLVWALTTSWCHASSSSGGGFWSGAVISRRLPGITGVFVKTTRDLGLPISWSSESSHGSPLTTQQRESIDVFFCLNEWTLEDHNPPALKRMFTSNGGCVCGPQESMKQLLFGPNHGCDLGEIVDSFPNKKKQRTPWGK